MSKQITVIEGGKRGRKAFRITDEMLNAVTVYASHGLWKKDIARCLGISYQTFNEHFKKNPDLVDAYELGESMGVADVSCALYQQAIRGESWAVKFYLNNRRPEQWKDKPEVDVNVNHGITLVVDEIDMRA
jgi:hypothetical protein